MGRCPQRKILLRLEHGQLAGPLTRAEQVQEWRIATRCSVVNVLTMYAPTILKPLQHGREGGKRICWRGREH